MKTIRRAAPVAILLLFVASLAQAGEVKGRVSAPELQSAENIVVYIDAIPGKKFDHPVEHVSVDQRNSVFIPHTLGLVHLHHQNRSCPNPSRFSTTPHSTARRLQLPAP
jgi:hypothetical protein